ncbi:hypothetical protein ACFVHQ_00650 [Actinomycetes bacterium NPDC127524]
MGELVWQQIVPAKISYRLEFFFCQRLLDDEEFDTIGNVSP